MAGSGWRQLCREEADTEPVFIVGVPRSGTTALRNTLERHSAFAPRARGSAETRVFVRPRRILRVLEPEGAPLLEFLLNDRRAAERMLADARAVRGVRRPQRLGASAWARSGNRDRVRVFFHHARIARGVGRLLEKTPSHALHLPELRETYPRARVIACLRHPIEVYSSYRKRLARAAERDRLHEGLEWLSASPSEFAESYSDCVEALLDDRERHADSIRLVTYEALTARPNAGLAELCAFLGESFEEGPLIDDVEPRRSPSGSPRLRGRIAPSQKRWSDFVSGSEARELERRLAPQMERLGYAPLA